MSTITALALYVATVVVTVLFSPERLSAVTASTSWMTAPSPRAWSTIFWASSLPLMEG